ncbi:MAG: 50S ribosomal protein L3 [Chloroflexi bacterium]|nr:50S ribosomal protein L3 [Chloroflexota bacterium]
MADETKTAEKTETEAPERGNAPAMARPMILGRKVGMLQHFKADGSSVAATVIAAEANVVTQVRTPARDGYAAVQLGFGKVTKGALSKAETGHLKGLPALRHLREVRLEDSDGFTPGQEIGVDRFAPGDKVHVTGMSKGKGFMGPVHLHHFTTGPRSHGSDHYRRQGSVGAGTTPGRVLKGLRMASHQGADRVTVKNLEILRSDPERALLIVQGAVPGGRNGIVMVVARPLTRTIAPPPARPAPKREAPSATAPKPKAEPRPLPTAPAGQVAVIGTDGTVTGSVALPGALTTTKTRAGVLFQVLDTARSNAHLGTAATKTRGDVAGGGAKPWAQKGTGRARAGSTRSPLWRHGGVAFGPNGRRYRRRIPEKMRRAAFAEAFAARASDGRVLVFEGFSSNGDGARTKTFVDWLSKIGDTGRALLVTPQLDETAARATANHRGLSVRSVSALRTVDVITHDTVLVHRDALEALAARATSGGSA